MSGISRRAGELCRLHQVGMKSCLFLHPIAKQATFAASNDGPCAGGQPIAVTHNFQAAAAGNSLDTGARVEVARPATVGSLAFLASEVDKSRQEVIAPTCSCDTVYLPACSPCYSGNVCAHRRCLPDQTTTLQLQCLYQRHARCKHIASHSSEGRIFDHVHEHPLVVVGPEDKRCGMYL